MRFLLQALLIGTLALVLGGGSAWYTLRQTHTIGAITLGPWSAFVHESAEETDPYMVAKAVAEGTVPLGATEGLTFETRTDSDGAPLLLQCDYRIEGSTPPARLWTLVSYGADGKPVPPAPGGESALHSMRILRCPDGSFRIFMSSQPSAGNWMAISGRGEMRLALRLYDTPITASAGLAPPSMPSILREGCRP